MIVPRDRIVDQWIERLLEHTDLKREDIGIAQADKCDFRGKKVVVGMVHSLCKDKYGEEFKRYFGTVFMDEVHTAGAETFSRVLAMFPAKYRIGVSATLKRADGMHDLYKLHIAQVHLKMEGGVESKPMILLREYKGEDLAPVCGKDAGRKE